MNALVPMAFGEIEKLAASIARSKLFGVQNPDQALALMMIAHAEGRHPALAARDYDIIQNKPAKKAEAMLRDFLASGGKVQWHALTDEKADATFSHPQGGTVRIEWDKKRAETAGLSGKDMWKKFPRQMLRSRTVSEGVRTVYPSATSGMYVPEEVSDAAPEDPAFQGATIEARAEEVPPPAPRMSISQWLDNFELSLAAAATRADVDLILESRDTIKAASLFSGAAKERFDDACAAALQRTEVPAPPAEEPEAADEVEQFLAKLDKMSVTEVERLDSNAAHRRWVKGLGPDEQSHVNAAIADRLIARAGA